MFTPSLVSRALFMALSCPCTSLIPLSMTPLLPEDLTGEYSGNVGASLLAPNDSVDDRLHGGFLIRLEYDFRRLVTKLFNERDDALDHTLIYGPFLSHEHTAHHSRVPLLIVHMQLWDIALLVPRFMVRGEPLRAGGRSGCTMSDTGGASCCAHQPPLEWALSGPALSWAILRRSLLLSRHQCRTKLRVAHCGPHLPIHSHRLRISLLHMDLQTQVWTVLSSSLPPCPAS